MTVVLQDPEELNGTTKSAAAKAKRKRQAKKKSKTEEYGGDTPRAFRALINHEQTIKKAKEYAIEQEAWKKEATKTPVEKEKLKRKVGESMYDFNRRVDVAVPVTFAKTANKTGDKELDDIVDRRARRQSEKQKKQNQEHLNMLRNKQQKLLATTDKHFDEHEMTSNEPTSRKRKKSPDPWAVLLKPERKYKFNDSVHAPPALTIKGKLAKRVGIN